MEVLLPSDSAHFDSYYAGSYIHLVESYCLRSASRNLSTLGISDLTSLELEENALQDCSQLLRQPELQKTVNRNSGNKIHGDHVIDILEAAGGNDRSAAWNGTNSFLRGCTTKDISYLIRNVSSITEHAKSDEPPRAPQTQSIHHGRAAGSRKRPRQSKQAISEDEDDQDSDGDGDDGDDDPKSLKTLGPSYDGPRLACPFHKFKPSKYTQNISTGSMYRACGGPGWVDIARLKEHLYRVHRKPIQCARCFATFTTNVQLATHLRQDIPCHKNDAPPITDHIDEEKEHKLRKKMMLNSSTINRWFQVWHILFPDETPPPDPWYHDSFASESLIEATFKQRLDEQITQKNINFRENPEDETKLKLYNLLHDVLLTCRQESDPSSKASWDDRLSLPPRGGGSNSYLSQAGSDFIPETRFNLNTTLNNLPKNFSSESSAAQRIIELQSSVMSRNESSPGTSLSGTVTALPTMLPVDALQSCQPAHSVSSIGETPAAVSSQSFACDIPGCKGTFTRRSDQNRHMLSCHTDRRFQCPVCEKTFTRPDKRRDHMRRVHEWIT